MRYTILFLLSFFIFNKINAQLITDSISKNTDVPIQYIHSDSLIGIIKEGANFNRLMGNVSLEHAGNTLTCDSAYFYQEQNYVEAFGNVNIVNANGTHVNADYLKYTGKNNLAYLKNNVNIIDGNNNLQGKEITYNTTTKIAKYYKGATLQSNETQLTSNEGTYNGKTKDCEFIGDVVVTNPEYNLESKALRYNTNTEFVTFLKESTIVTDGTTINGTKGSWDAKKEIGNFSTRSTVFNDDNQITANSLHYEKKLGTSLAKGNVVIEDFKNSRRVLANNTFYNEKTKFMFAEGQVIINDFEKGRMLFANKIEYNQNSRYTIATKNVWVYDSTENNILHCQQLEVNQNTNYMLAQGNPVLRSLANKDSLFIRANKIFSAPSAEIDSIKKIEVATSTKIDSVLVNKNNENLQRTTLFIGSVVLFSDSMQAIADSISYSGADSIFKLYKKPMLWTQNNQALADTIHILTTNNKVSQVNLYQNASMISYTKAADYYDQIYGNTMQAFIVNDEIQNVKSNGNAISIYFNKNEKQEYIGMNKSESSLLNILMKNNKVSRITFIEKPTGKFVPMQKLVPAETKAANFIWNSELRPKNKLAVINFSSK